MSYAKIEIRDWVGNIYKVDSWKVEHTLKNMVFSTFARGKFPLDETWEIRQGDSEWCKLTESFRKEMINSLGDALKTNEQASEKLHEKKENKNTTDGLNSNISNPEKEQKGNYWREIVAIIFIVYIFCQLLAIKSQLASLKLYLDDISGDVSSLNYGIGSIKSDVDSIESDVDSIESDVDSIESYVDSIESDVDSIESDVDSIGSDMDFLQTNVNSMQEVVNSIRANVIELLLFR
jgi:chromosome segregation ATPase